MQKLMCASKSWNWPDNWTLVINTSIEMTIHCKASFSFLAENKPQIWPISQHIVDQKEMHIDWGRSSHLYFQVIMFHNNQEDNGHEIWFNRKLLEDKSSFSISNMTKPNLHMMNLINLQGIKSISKYTYLPWQINSQM